MTSMGGWRYEAEIKIISAKNLKNVNWRHGPLKPYAAVWVDDPKAKWSARVDEEGDENPYWDDTLTIPFNSPIHHSTLHIDILHANSAGDDDANPLLIGSARLHLRDLGIGHPLDKKLQIERPSGRPHGKLQVSVNVREPLYYAPPPPPPPMGYPYGSPPAYGQASYDGQPGYGSMPGYYEEKKKSKFGGMGTGLAVGAVGGLLGGLALAEGADYVRDHIAEDAADKVEDDDLAFDGDAAGDDW